MKVFIVEDSEVILGHLRRIVSEVPGAILLGESAHQDRAVADILRKPPDLLILDLALAQGSGMELLRHIRPRLPSATIIVLTNKSAAAYRKRCLEQGADYFFDKSRDMDALVQRLMALSDS